MNFNEYHRRSRVTAIYPGVGNNLWYPTLGLSGEVGEVAEKVKKIYRDKEGIVGLDDKLAIIKELGDVLWYVANIASELKISLNDVARQNLKKLSSRVVLNKLHGSGDER